MTDPATFLTEDDLHAAADKVAEHDDGPEPFGVTAETLAAFIANSTFRLARDAPPVDLDPTTVAYGIAIGLAARS